eukprot:TRINITY_DN69387_c0_g1_i1.p1 TRINITY_DN69387_c0_g1~~TRINITY_DN69387_c0_g1_i1.p1  ORF type:complete len:492 (-),score=110.70 TRINITY_DN69387_c0_g1_i1:80-1555(-)
MAATAGGTGASGGAAADLDLQAVESIPKDTLVALLRRKDKESKALSVKIEKLEERYVKVVRFNRVFLEDRTSFLRFCNELLPDSDGIFEEAAAQEIPVNVEALLHRLTEWRAAFEAACADRQVFQKFAELVFPGDDDVSRLFESPALGEAAFDTLQNKFVALEELHSQSVASINSMAREQVLSRSQEHDAALIGKQAADRRCQELQEQLTVLAREKAQLLKQKLEGAGDSVGLNSKQGGDTRGATVENSRASSDLQQQLELSERRAAKAAEMSAEREQMLRQAVDTQQSENLRLQRELNQLREETENHRKKASRDIEDKDQVREQLQRQLAELEVEVTSNAFINRLAEQQAGRDVEVKAQQKQVAYLTKTVSEVQRLLDLSYTQEKVLKDRIRELEGSYGREHVAGDYLKHVVLKYILYNQRGNSKAQTLVPVLCTLLSFSPEECRSVDQTAIPQSLQLINQAVGGAASWLRGDEREAASIAASSRLHVGQ